MMILIKAFLKNLITPLKPLYKGNSKAVRIINDVLSWCIVAFLPIYVFLMTEYIHFSSKRSLMNFIVNRTSAVIFDLVLLYIIWALVLLIVKKGFYSALIYVAFFGAISTVNYLKFSMTGDYLYPWDILEQTGNVGELLNFITVPYPIIFIALIGFGLLLSLPLLFSDAKIPLKWYLRIPISVLIAVLCFISVSTPQRAQKLLNRNSLRLEDMALQNSNYMANGFIGAFSVNVLSANIEEPENYSEKTVSEMINKYSDTAGMNEKTPDIILVLSESFWDPALLCGTKYYDVSTGNEVDPLSNYREICKRDGTIFGKFYTTGFGGGTVRPEFEVLTGLTTDYLPAGSVPFQYINEDMPSYISALCDMGYETMALHPYTSSFYCRKDTYPHIGIDTLIFEDEFHALEDDGIIDIKVRGNQISDETFIDALTYYLDADADKSKFIFGISMENHQPYADKFDKPSVICENENFDDELSETVANYVTGVLDADFALAELCDYIDKRGKDTVLIWFGDHLPTLGSNFGAYQESGMVGKWDTEDYKKIYSTPFLVYSNFDIGNGKMLKSGSGNEIASYNLMNGVFELLHFPASAYMNFLRDYYDLLPNYNIRLHMYISDDAKVFAEYHKIFTYDFVAGERFLLD